MAEFPREGLGDGTLCHSREIRGLEERVAPLVFLPGLHLSLRWGEQPLPDLPLPGKAALGHDSQDGGNHWVPPPQKPGPAGWSGRDIPEPLKASPPGGPAGRPPSPAPSPPGAPCTGIPAAHSPRSGALVSHSLSAAGSRRPLGWVRRPLGPVRGWWSRAGRAGQSQEHFGGGRGF